MIWATIANVCLVVYSLAVSLTPLFVLLILWNAENKQILSFIKASQMAFRLFIELKDLTDSKLDGSQLFSDILCKEWESLDSMKSLRMFIRVFLDKGQLNSKLLDSLQLLLVPKLLLILCSVQWKHLKSECKLLTQELSRPTLPKDSIKSKLMKELMDFTKASLLFGADKFHTQWLSLQLLKILWKLSISTRLQTPRTATLNQLSWWSHFCLDIGLVFSALLFLIQLIQWSQYWTKNQEMPQLVSRLKKYMQILDSKVFGTVLVQELLWLVLLLVCNGGYTTRSRLLVVFKQQVESEILYLLRYLNS